ncbi:leucine-rich repeat domain-containing protein [Amedibacillus sp. YH-ame6]
MEKKVGKVLLSSTMILTMAFSVMPANVFAQESNIADNTRAGNISIDYTNFPDSVFQDYVKKVVDTDKNYSLSQEEINNITKIDAPKEIANIRNVTSFKGIEHFTALTELSIEKVPFLKSIDLSQNIALTSLSISESKITDLDLSANINLKKLIYKTNPITSLDLSANTALTYLDCGWNVNLKDLNISKNTALTYLNFENCQVESIDVSKNIKLESLKCWSNQLTRFDVSQNKDLTLLDCTGNQLTILDVSQNKDLTTLACGDNQLKNLDVSKNSDLESLECYSNQLTILDVSQNKDLESLVCYENNLTNLDVSENLALSELICGDNQLKNLDVSNNSDLESLECYSNQLISLDLSKNDSLTYLDCSAQTRTIAYDESKGYSLSAYDAGFDKSKATEFVGAIMEDDGTLTGVTSDTPITYNYDTGYFEPLRSNGMLMDVTLTFTEKADTSKLEEAKSLVETAIKDMKVSNTTTDKDFLDRVKNSITSITGVTVSWKSGSPIITKATNYKDGSITGKIILTSDDKTIEIDVNKVINKLSVTDDEKLTKAKPLAEKAITDISATNDTTAGNILDKVKTRISSVDDVTASWEDSSPIITKATKDKEGSITGTIILTSGSKSIEIAVDKVIDKLSSKTTIVDKTTGIEIAYEDGSAFEDDITLVVTPKSKEEMKGFQNNVNKVVPGKTIAGVYDIKLLKNGVEIQPDGKLKISLTLTDAMKAMSELQVVYIDENGKVTIIPSQLVNGQLVFVTDHFSYYGVIGKEKSTGQIQPETPSKPSSPQTGDTSNGMLYFGWIVVSGSLAVMGLKKKKALGK